MLIFFNKLIAYVVLEPAPRLPCLSGCSRKEGRGGAPMHPQPPSRALRSQAGSAGGLGKVALSCSRATWHPWAHSLGSRQVRTVWELWHKLPPDLQVLVHPWSGPLGSGGNSGPMPCTSVEATAAGGWERDSCRNTSHSPQPAPSYMSAPSPVTCVPKPCPAPPLPLLPALPRLLLGPACSH